MPDTPEPSTITAPEAPQYVRWFRHASTYINNHRDRTFVVMLSGEAIAHSGFAAIAQDLRLLHSLGVRLVLVFGARPQIARHLADHDLPSAYHDHLRVTDSAALESVKQAVGVLRLEIEAQLASAPLEASRGADLRVVSGNFVLAKPYGVHEGVDFGYTGSVRRVDRDAITNHLNKRELVLIPPVGYSATGELFNLSFETLAGEVAIALGAEKLIAFSDKPGVLDASGQLLRLLPLQQARAQLTAGELAGSPALRACVHACSGGVRRGHIVSYQQDGALLTELFTRDGAGTLLLSDAYESLRPAQIDDVGGLMELIRPLEADGTLVRRSRERLETEIDRFTVIDRDGLIIGCAALYPCPGASQQSGEVACVAIHPEYRNGERGDGLLRHLESLARSQGMERLFVLTTRTAHWFRERGFVPAPIDALPAERRSLYNYQRNAQVYTKPLV
ncbi:MAG: amino-acid N-acetyltransferase [Pseudomonadota bacterium]|nr:amino-acid N-acetyltransferase [Pseudomonadota bacterium]